MEAQWKKLYSDGGCLTGQQHWHGRRKPEGSVFREVQWQDFLNYPPNEVIPFLANKFGSKALTNIHVCPFENATEGELAVFVSEYIIESNWFDCSSSYKTLYGWSKKEFTQLTRLMIEDPLARDELIDCFTHKIE